MEEIDKSFPWGYFDGVAQGEPNVCGGGGVLLLTKTHSFQIMSGLEEGSNNYAELMALKILLLVALEKGYRKIQIFGDSMLIINWAKGIHRYHVMRLFPLVEEVHHLKY